MLLPEGPPPALDALASQPKVFENSTSEWLMAGPAWHLLYQVGDLFLSLYQILSYLICVKDV